MNLALGVFFCRIMRCFESVHVDIKDAFKSYRTQTNLYTSQDESKGR